MSQWQIQYSNSAAKELERLPSKTVEKVRSKVYALKDEPRPHGCKKLKGADDTYRLRVGDYRVVYEIHEKEVIILIIRVRHRKDAYD